MLFPASNRSGQVIRLFLKVSNEKKRTMGKKLAVVALGGNALLRGDQVGTIEEQEKNTTDTLENLIYLVREGYDLVLTHGNGPQVGNILMRNDAGEQIYNIAQMPIDICVADSQGGIGYMIERMFRNVLNRHGIKKNVVCIVTQVIVNQDDPALTDPQKRIGKIYNSGQADELALKKGWVFREEVKIEGGFRRVVPSPLPVGIMNESIIRDLARNGTIVIAAGGGGVPVYLDENNDVRTTEAVIDKDLASSLLATRIGADEFYILTDVPYIYINYKKPDQEIKEFLNYKDALKYLNEGQFAKGSMAPKIQACLNFIQAGGRKSVITEAFKLADKKYGSKITMEYED
ncbi:MAG: carbamate kinase [Bacteroidales bacterium]